MAAVSGSFVWLVVVPDLRFRARRFAITAVGGGLIFSITLLLSGFSAGFDLSAERFVNEMGAAAYLVPEGVEGPFTSYTPFPAPDLADGSALLAIPSPLVADGTTDDVLVIGHEAGGFGEPRVVEGQGVEASDEVVLDRTIPSAEVGDEVNLGGQRFAVVGLTEHRVTPTGLPSVFIPIDRAREMFTGGLAVATTVALPESIDPPAGFAIVSRDAAERDLVRQMGDARASINTFTITLWALAAIIIGAVLYLAALERVRDFAVLKATGARNSDLMLGLSIQAVVVAVVASLLAVGFAKLLEPVYPGLITMPIRVIAPLPFVAVLIGLFGSAAGVRRATRVDPAQAFGGP